jgi:cysteine desulfurase
VYLDHAATTPMRPEARAAMEPYFGDLYANPSGSHAPARRVRAAVDDARDTIASVVGCEPGEVIFTSGGTEGANTVILGARGRGSRSGDVRHTVACPAAEHHAVLHCVEHLDGVVVPVTATGATDPDVLAASLGAVVGAGAEVAVVSVMAVNNEVGTVNDMAAIVRAVRRAAPDAVLHTDAVQAATWCDLRSIWPHVDAMSLSAHKFGGPKGCGVLVLRSGTASTPLILGGGQERDRRSGTHNVAGIVGTAEALRLTDGERTRVVLEASLLRDVLQSGICAAVPEASVTVPDLGATVPGIAHLCLEGMESEALLYLLDRAGVYASAASACASGAMDPSHVLAAMGVPRERAKGSLRFSLGHVTSKADVEAAVAATVAAADRIREHAEARR